MRPPRFSARIPRSCETRARMKAAPRRRKQVTTAISFAAVLQRAEAHLSIPVGNPDDRRNGESEDAGYATAIDELIGDRALSNTSARASASASRVRMATIAEASTNIKDCR